MRSKHPLALLLGLALTLPAVPAEAVPPFIRHEGLFLDEDGLPRLGDTQVQFSLWDAPTDGELLWRETRDISLTDGYYSVAFGELESLERVFDEEVTYLGISVDGEPEYDPRQRMGSVPYALIADNVTGDITPSSIRVGGQIVVDNEGNWVGPPPLTADDLLTLVHEVDGTGSGLDADALDGLDGTKFMRVDQDTGTAGSLTVGGALSVRGGVVYYSGVSVATGNLIVAEGNHGVGREPEYEADIAGTVRADAFLLGGREEAPEDPAAGTMYFDSDAGRFLGYDGEAWRRLSGSAGGGGGGGAPPPGGDGFEGPVYGTGDDGPVTVAAPNTVINRYAEVLAGVIRPGDTAFQVRNPDGFSAGDEVMIVQMQHAATSGTFEYAELARVEGDTFTVTEGVSNAFYSGGPNRVDAAVTQIVSVPHFTDVQVLAGNSMTAAAWNGHRGGILTFRATGRVTVSGKMDVTAKGFRGGIQQPTSHRGGYQGESWTGLGRAGPNWYTNVCGGTVNNPNPTDEQAGPNGGGGSGGYGGCHGGGGGGGVYGGRPEEACTTGCDPPGDQRGWGAPECGRSGFWAKSGDSYGAANMTRIHLGSGGGGGNSYSASARELNMGGDGGGIILAFAPSFTVTGRITADGEQGFPQAGTAEFNSIETSNWQDGSGGAGSGGAVYLSFVSASLGNERVTAVGGPCGARAGWPGQRHLHQRGANGGLGRIRLDYEEVRGSTHPAAFHRGEDGSEGALAVRALGTVVNAYSELVDGVVGAGDDRIEVADSGAFSAGDEVLILQMQNQTGAGTYEFKTLDAVQGAVLAFTEELENTYYSDRFDAPNASASQVIRVPRYTEVTILGGASITAEPWDGRTGGVVAFRVEGDLDVFGKIDVDGLGFRGGQHQRTSHRGGYKGESWTGLGGQGPDWYTGVCGGTVNNPNPTVDQAGPNGGGGSGGYGGCHGGGGGGGVYGGLPTDQCSTACDPPGDQRGWGAPECGRSGFWSMPGRTYGTRDLSTLLLGSGGGGGNNYSASDSQLTAGGAGGGIVFVEAENITVDGEGTSGGAQGLPLAGTERFGNFETTNWQDGSGGAGSGGSIHLNFTGGDIGTGRVSALGGPCGARTGWPGARTLAQRGANGGVGRVRLDYETLRGTSFPAPFHRTQDGEEVDVSVFAAGTVLNAYTEILDITVPDGSRDLSVAAAGEFVAGDEVLVVQMQHSSAAGTFERAEIASTRGDRITLTEDLQHRYYSRNFNGQSAWAAQVVRIPRFQNLTVLEGASVTAPPWDGRIGGVVALSVVEDLVVFGDIDVGGRGFRGGPRQPQSHKGGFQGESWAGLGREGPNWYTNVCGGTVNNPNPTDDQAGPNRGGGGGGYGGCHGGGGAAGVYAGPPADQCSTSCDPGGDQRGWGAPECGRSGYWSKPGIAYGDAQLSRLYLGSGGGSGNSYSADAGQPNQGGAGGGVLFVETGGLIVEGGMNADGQQGYPLAGTPQFASAESSNWQDGSGGAGSGGSVHLVFTDGVIGNARVTAQGGPCGARAGWPGRNTLAQRGANGGPGRILLDFVNLAGSTLPAFSEGE